MPLASQFLIINWGFTHLLMLEHAIISNQTIKCLYLTSHALIDIDRSRTKHGASQNRAKKSKDDVFG